MPRNKNPNNHETRFKGKGVGLDREKQPLSVRFPPDILEMLKANPDRQEFVRAAVVEKLEREALLPSPEVAIDTPADQDVATIDPESTQKKRRGRKPKVTQ